MLKKDFIDTIFKFFIASQKTVFIIKQKTKPELITQIQYNILENIYYKPGKQLSEISECLGLSLPNASREVKKLIAKDLLYKEYDQADKRNHYIYLSLHGKAMMEDVIKKITENLEMMFGGLCENSQNEIIKNSKALLDNLLK